ncbi:MAG: hypothetical protein JNM17_17295 [Archangium sp.]|nr:hypothetical protein [Archangium sp.]
MRLVLACSLLASTGAFAQVTKSTVMVSMPNCNPAPALTNYPADVYRPAGSGPFGLVAIGHGFQNSKDNHEVLARALASRGIVVVVPQFPLLIALQCASTDHARNSRILLAAVDQIVSAGGIDTARIGIAGHSAGGLSAFLAASQRSFAAVLLFDAVDQNNLGSAAVPMVTAPVLAVSAPSSQCNSSNNSAAWFTGLTGLKGTIRVVGASHCEPQDPVSPTCSGACSGTVTAARQAVFQKYAVSFFERFLLGVNVPCLETLAAADEMAGVISMVDLRFGGCVASDAGVADSGVDAGVDIDAGVDAGVDAGDIDAGIDAGVAIDAGVDAGADDAGTNRPANDAGQMMMSDAGGMGAPVDAGTDVTEPPRGCGCSSASALFAVLGLLLMRRRR